MMLYSWYLRILTYFSITNKTLVVPDAVIVQSQKSEFEKNSISKKKELKLLFCISILALFHLGVALYSGYLIWCDCSKGISSPRPWIIFTIAMVVFATCLYYMIYDIICIYRGVPVYTCQDLENRIRSTCRL